MAYDINDEKLVFSAKFGSVKVALLQEPLQQRIITNDNEVFTFLLNDYEHEDNTQSYKLTYEEVSALITLLKTAL